MISLIVALYNEEQRFPVKYLELKAFLSTLNEPWEMILVDDGSSDNTFLRIKELRADDARIRCYRLVRNLGQGAAVKLGAQVSKGDVVLYTDADLSVPLLYIQQLIIRVRNGCDIAIASRWMEGSNITSPQPSLRRNLGKFYYVLIRCMLLKEINDTNCGLKAYRGETARIIFGFVRSWGWAFNVESLWLARQMGYRIDEIPVEWAHREASKVHVFRDCVFTLWEIFNIKLRQVLRIYPSIRLS